MARRCVCSAILGEATNNLKLLNLPALAQLLWQRLALYISEHGENGRLEFSKPEWLWRRVSMAETEVETYLETLLGAGLLQRDEADALICPLLAFSPSTASRSAENGRRGGRPRKGETKEVAKERRQAELLYPISGGARTDTEKPSETQRWENPSAGAAPRGPTTTSLSTETSDSLVARGFVQLAKDVIAEGGLTYRRLTFDEAKVWLRLGEQHGKTEAETRAIVLGAVRKQMRRKAPEDVKSLAFFTGLIGRVMSGEEALDDVVFDSSAEQRAADFDREADAWIAGGMRGPAPQRRVA